jgi:hypothetical protein
MSPECPSKSVDHLWDSCPLKLKNIRVSYPYRAAVLILNFGDLTIDRTVLHMFCIVRSQYSSRRYPLLARRRRRSYHDGVPNLVEFGRRNTGIRKTFESERYARFSRFVRPYAIPIERQLNADCDTCPDQPILNC